MVQGSGLLNRDRFNKLIRGFESHLLRHAQRGYWSAERTALDSASSPLILGLPKGGEVREWRRKNHGEVAEWFKALVLKTGVAAMSPGVRIPPSPPQPSSVVP